MKPSVQQAQVNDDAYTAIGLIWGHLKTRQFNDAHTLARACMQLWPNEPMLRILQSYAAIEIGLRLDDDAMDFLRSMGDAECADQLLRKAEIHRNVQGLFDA